MARIAISTNLSLDGVVQDPDGQESFRHGGWFGRYGGADLEPWRKVMLDEARGTEAMLLGRRSDDWFASRWLSRTGEWADLLNGAPKYVVSSTAERVAWGDGTLLRGDPVSEVSKLKAEVDGVVLILASYQLTHTLIDHDLVDQLRLTVFPVVIGEGDRLFGSTHDVKAWRLVDATTIGDDLVHLVYELDRGA